MLSTTMTTARLALAGLLLGTCCVVLAADPAPTDDLVWDTGYPKALEMPGKKGFYLVESKGKTNTNKYPAIIFAKDLIIYSVYKIDKDKKELPKTRINFRTKSGNVIIEKGTWNFTSTVLDPDETLWLEGFSPGKYRIIINAKVKHTPKSSTTDAILVKDVDILGVAPPPPPPPSPES
jgi:hypothetical protein